MQQKKLTPAELSKLQDLWYAKLEKTGFKDAEQKNGMLKQWESHAFGSRYNHHLFNSKSKYYQLAGQFLHEHEFESKREKTIWELHSEGLSMTDISQEMKKRGYKVFNRTGIHVIVQALAKEMLNKYGSDDDEE